MKVAAQPITATKSPYPRRTAEGETRADMERKVKAMAWLGRIVAINIVALPLLISTYELLPYWWRHPAPFIVIGAAIYVGLPTLYGGLYFEATKRKEWKGHLLGFLATAIPFAFVCALYYIDAGDYPTDRHPHSFLIFLTIPVITAFLWFNRLKHTLVGLYDIGFGWGGLNKHDLACARRNLRKDHFVTGG